jgi:hypothetical protein
MAFRMYLCLVASYFWGLDLSRVHDVKLEGIFAYLCIEKC